MAGATRLPMQNVTGTFLVGQTIIIDPLGDADIVTITAILGTPVGSIFTTTRTSIDHLTVSTLVTISNSYIIPPSANVSMVVQLVESPQPLPVSYSAVITNGGYTAEYTTMGQEFGPPVGGEYNIALNVAGPQSPPAYTFTSPWRLLRIAPLEYH
jgi:hypothetical protein